MTYNEHHEQIAVNEVDKVQADLEAKAAKKAEKILRKNAREIERLKLWAEKAIIDDNRDAYIYAIGKLRDIYKQPHTPELLSAMWVSTRQTVLSML
ncbi:hypothetical protein EcMakalu001_041 [Escherichia phage Ec_Makalu_001]|uniref:Uncharacterized protein n=3 Tax=Krischvirus gec3s TaxID=2560444 RepID=A0A6B9SQ01_9CAUD|nr:hypothetical protein Makalu002_041 [Escherichia phage Ec_Makalu_002]QHJ72989.1 hypothetical protein Makalu003_041 [Escherichia phage Ec_Makalu_003]QHJ73262.1 hypothetical protein EcMakalu001_041 [Escherichia phage Ec_Makalu_001]